MLGAIVTLCTGYCEDKVRSQGHVLVMVGSRSCTGYGKDKVKSQGHVLVIVRPNVKVKRRHHCTPGLF